MKKVSIKQFAANYNHVRNRRGHFLSEGYIYRLIRQDISGNCTRLLWFKYVLEGAKDHIYIIV
jgi:hypothetical protein